MADRRPAPVEWVSEESDKNTDGRNEMARVKAHKGLQLEFTSKKRESQRLEGGENGFWTKERTATLRRIILSFTNYCPKFGRPGRLEALHEDAANARVDAKMTRFTVPS